MFLSKLHVKPLNLKEKQIKLLYLRINVIITSVSLFETYYFLLFVSVVHIHFSLFSFFIELYGFLKQPNCHSYFLGIENHFCFYLFLCYDGLIAVLIFHFLIKISFFFVSFLLLCFVFFYGTEEL